MTEKKANPPAGPDDSQETVTNPETKGDAGTVKLPTEVQVSKEGEGQRKSIIEPHEAIRRGLSFGPLRKNGGRHNSTTGILKTSSKSPSSRLNQGQRTLSSGSDMLASAGVGRLKKDRYVDDPDGEAAVESSDEDPQAWSSGDEATGLGKARGRKRDTKDSERTASRSPLAASDSERPAVVVTGAGEKPVSTSKRFIVRPNTNYDRNVSRGPSPSTSDSEVRISPAHNTFVQAH